MDDIFVARVMSTTLYTVSPDTLVEDAGQKMLENDIGSVMVVDESNQLEGILTSTDFITIVAESKPKAETTVSRYMTTDVITTTAQESISNVADLMLEHGFHHVPVVDKDEGVIGMMTTSDMTKYISNVETPDPGDA